MSDLKKFQRRQYFRLECTLDIEYRRLEDSDVEKIKEDPELIRDIMESEPFTSAIVLDISGGGVRFASEEKLEPDSNILVDLNISTESGQKVYGVMAKVLSSGRIINKDHMYEQRVEIAGHTREAIIKFIFEQERRLRKK
jgi:c-di-GMP-binding flagellar brake protein YcgR